MRGEPGGRRTASRSAALILAVLSLVPFPLAALEATRGAPGTPPGSAAAPQSAIAMRGRPRLAEGFAAFSYVNPDAPRGGRLTLSLAGTFDSLNPFIVKGSAPGIMRDHVVQSLMARSFDEPFTLYPLLARQVASDLERSFVEFTLDPRAHFSDGSPVTAEDVLFSFALMRDHGRPNHRLYYSKVEKAEALPGGRVRFTFNAPDPELPLIMGLMPVLSKAKVDPAHFEETSLSPLMGSGPYKVGHVEAGATLALERDPNYWARDLPINRGQNNFDEIRFLYFRDANGEFEAFKKGLVDARFETDPTRWETGYDFPAARDGNVVREVIPTGTPKPYSALVFNTRREIFADARARRALIELFDFEWLDRNFYHSLYKRTVSFFQDSELASTGRPADQREQAILAPFPDAVVPEALLGTLRPPVSDGSGRDRSRRRTAYELLEAAGWELSDGRVRRKGTGEPFAFEIMVATRDQERLALAYANQLERAGITAKVRFVDAVQFDARRRSYDFDMAPAVWSQSLSPGNEQAFYFGSEAADTPGTRNYMGVKSKAVDAAIAALIAAKDEEDFISAARLLDRLLLSGGYAVPLFHTPGQWLARWTRIARPERPSLYGTLPQTWWRVPGR